VISCVILIILICSYYVIIQWSDCGVVYDCVMSNVVVFNIVVFVKNVFCHCRTAVVSLIKMN